MAPAARALALVTAIAVAAAGSGPALTPAHAQEAALRGMPVIRDTEMEQLLRDYAQPILRAAGLAHERGHLHRAAALDALQRRTADAGLLCQLRLGAVARDAVPLEPATQLGEHGIVRLELIETHQL